MESMSRVRIGPCLGLIAPVALGCIVFGLWEAPATAQPGPAGPIGMAQPGAAQRTAYGYFPTRWRQWPCDARVDQHFPTSVGREHVPRPPGQPLGPDTFRQPLPVPEGLRQPDTQGPGTLPGGPSMPTEPPGGVLPGALPGGLGPAGPGGGLELPAEPQLPDTTQPSESLLPGLPGTPLPGEPGAGGAMQPESLLPGEPTPGGTGSGLRPEPPRVEPLLPGVPLDPDSGAGSLMRRPAAPEGPGGMRTSDSNRTAIHQPPLNTGPQRRSPIYRPPIYGPAEQTDKRTRPAGQERPVGASELATIQADWETVLQASERSHHGGLSGRYGSPLLAWHRAEPIPDQQDDQPLIAQQAHVQAPGQPSRDVRTAGFESPLPTALDGFCPVELVKNERWVRGDSRWAIDYQGRRYLMSSEIQRESFLVNPQRYVPAYEGNDPVLVVDRGQRIPGITRYCATYDSRLYMFSNPATLAHFRQQPEHYALEP